MMARRFQSLILHIFLIIAAIISIYPFFIMIFGSLKSAAELSANPAGWPIHLTFDNYIRLLGYSGGVIIRSFLNGIYVSAVHTVLTVFISAMAAYAFAKYEFKGRNWMFIILLSTIMVPGELKIPALYVFFSKIGWLNSYSVQIVPGIASVFAMFMTRQFMLSISNSLIEAVKMDGAGHWRTFLSLIMPICSPVLGALSILVFLGKWNDYLWPSIMISKQQFLPIIVLLPTINANEDATVPWELILTGCVLVTIPLILVFLRYQEKFMSSMTIGAVKG
ncbi:carbohydrate ABC transporter permease [Paenibacillus doosanensis]|uniref:carbohydrate ABC transporter permease n=1 Tax=Paenibacillus doosanensis TaxID=1229154 RepID=UPI00217F7F74|nr:carbohydrate ABC transporter permease [Paenibacillus doosanensis]MCS7461453.1 carbohydrate ABC transporter permease [Paenibacillus doosanensis]